MIEKELKNDKIKWRIFYCLKKCHGTNAMERNVNISNELSYEVKVQFAEGNIQGNFLCGMI